MTEPSPPLSRDPLTRRALELDALAAILPMDRRDRLAALLTDEDIATLKHLAKQGMGENSLRALASDLAYLEAWALAATKAPPALAGARGAGAQICRASPLGSGAARIRCHPWHAGGNRCGFAGQGAVAGRRSARAVDGPPAPCQLGEPASLERRSGSVRLASAALGDPAFCARGRAAADEEEPAGGDAGYSREAFGDLYVRPAGRYARRSAASRDLRLWWPAPKRSRHASHGAVCRGAARSGKPGGSELVFAALPLDSSRPHQDDPVRRGLPGVFGRTSGGGNAGVAFARGHCQGTGVSGDRSMGKSGE